MLISTYLDVGLSVGLIVGIIVGFAMGRRRVLLADYFEMPKLVPVTIAHSTQFAHSITYLIVACLGFALGSIVQTPVSHIFCKLPHLGDNFEIGHSIVSEQPRSVDYYNCAFTFDRVDRELSLVYCYVSFVVREMFI